LVLPAATWELDLIKKKAAKIGNAIVTKATIYGSRIDPCGRGNSKVNVTGAVLITSRFVPLEYLISASGSSTSCFKWDKVNATSEDALTK